jgi:hypothetical protein
MCPPPADPIWPIGPTLGQVYVPRTGATHRVSRRQRREDETDEQRRHHEHHELQPGETWIRVDEEPDPGTNDDHRRTSHRVDDDDPPVRRHVDAVA